MIVQENKKTTPVSNDNEVLVEYPYTQKDPYARVELVASSRVYGGRYSCDQVPALAARVSHAASGKTGKDLDKDKRLMNYLAKHQHFTPFEHQSATFKVILPLLVARHWMRHRTQSYNEVSMRYSADPVGKFYYPHEWRIQAKSNKQSSFGAVEDQAGCDKVLKELYDHALAAYKQLLEKGVCREQARMVVPVGNYTEFYATANLRNWMAFYRLRSADDAQWEIRQYAQAIGRILEKIWPESWGSLKNSL